MEIEKNKVLDKKAKFNIYYYFVLFIIIFILQDFYNKKVLFDNLSFSDFKSLLVNGKIKEVIISNDEVKGILKEPNVNKKTLVVSKLVDPSLSNEFDKL